MIYDKTINNYKHFKNWMNELKLIKLKPIKI